MNRQLGMNLGIGLGIVVLLVLYARLAYIPLAQRVAERRHAVAEKEILLEKARDVAAHYDDYAQQALKLKWEMQRLEQRLPSQPQIPELIKAVTKVATEVRIQDLQFVPQAMLDFGEYWEQPIQITMTCNYHALGSFISRLAGLPRLVNARDVRIVSKDKSGRTLSITAKLTLVTYVRKNR